MADFNIGIVGTGMMLEYHLNSFNNIAGIRVKGCTREFYGDSEKQNAQKKSLNDICEKLAIKAYADFDEMVNDADLAALIIASINPHHFTHIEKALAAGKHVLVEKPVVTDFRQLDWIKHNSEQRGLVLFPGHNFVYRPVITKAKELIKSGVLGTMVYSSFISCFRTGDVHAHGWRASAELSQGGALMDSGHHQIYQSLHLIGMPREIQGFTSKQVLKHMEVEDFAMINAYYPDGSIGSIGQGHSSNFGDMVSGIKIVGEKGNIVITDGCYHNGEKVADDDGYARSFDHQAKYFIDCVVKGKKPLSTLDDVRSSLKIVRAAYASAGQKSVVDLETFNVDM
jgi:predicted dehydrogenase